ncbi:MAG: hypothetical protein DMF49_01250 [Acidobacteria bacterium]|nr:MAG: hypothetical protein DMF49_01250 [Acidobacteriota bacterium]
MGTKPHNDPLHLTASRIRGIFNGGIRPPQAAGEGERSTDPKDGRENLAVTRVAGWPMTTQRSRRFRAQWPLLFALASLGQPLVAADASKLVSGVELPPLEVKALSGDLAALPRDARGHPAVLIIGFSKAAAEISRAWVERCRSAAAARPDGSGVYCYDVRMLEGVPRLFRGMVERRMRSSYPVNLQRQTLLVYSENDAWRQRVGAADEKTAYVIGCDREGRVRGTAVGQFLELELKKLLEAIEPMPPNRE